MRAIRQLLPVLLLGVVLQSAPAFSLLGPPAPWMTTNLGYIINEAGDIGGPMNLGEGYRWNVPVITYGFDQAFLDYFGTNGVAAVESAIQIVNDLPPASQINLSNYFLDTSRINERADALGLFDLKSAALGLILEHLGLASPARFTYTLRDFSDLNNFTVIMRNFDPETLAPSASVNGTLYSYYVGYDGRIAYCEVFPIDPIAAEFTAVADEGSIYGPGTYYVGLTRDDVGGLAYLYSTNNFALENLIPGVRGVGRNAGRFVATAIRPGVDKIAFQRLNYDERRHRFVPVTLRYEDSYLTNNMLQHQPLEREVKQPDILFTVQHLGFDEFTRTGTSNWVNNGAPSNDGPGVIQPPVTITFGRVGLMMQHLYYDSQYSIPDNFSIDSESWGSFDGTTNTPISYPVDSAKNDSTKVYFWLDGYPYPQPLQLLKNFIWTIAGQRNNVYLLQTSPDLTNWLTITTITNLGQDVNYYDYTFPSVPQRFFRVTPQ
jgi:hypothetical protein